MRGLAIVAASGLAVPLGALLGQVLSSWAMSIVPFVLALAAGILLKPFAMDDLLSRLAKVEEALRTPRSTPAAVSSPATAIQ